MTKSDRKTDAIDLLPSQTTTQLSHVRIFWFWIPLALMWVFMAGEQPVAAAFVTRLPYPKENLAAFGLAFSITLIFESPVIQLLTASTALAGSWQSYTRIRTFMLAMCLSLITVHVTIALTPLYALLVGKLIGAPESIIEPSRQAFLLMAPWPLAIGARRFWQGVLIRNGRTGILPLTTIIRLVVIAGTMSIGLISPVLPGAGLATLALTLGAIANAAAVYIFLRPIVREKLTQDPKPTSDLSWRRLIEFYVPLALSTFIAIGMRPIVNIGLARTPFPLESLAVYPVVYGFVFLFSSGAFSYQEVTVALLNREENHQPLRRFAVIMSVSIAVTLLLIALTPLGNLWFSRVAGLSAELLTFTGTPLLILSFSPIAVGLNAWYNGILISRAQTPVVTRAMGVTILILVLLLLLSALLLPFPGVTSAAIAIVGSLAAQSLYLGRATRHPSRLRGK